MNFLPSFLFLIFVTLFLSGGLVAASDFDSLSARESLERRIATLRSELPEYPEDSPERVAAEERLSDLEHLHFSLLAAQSEGRSLDSKSAPRSPHLALRHYQRALELQQRKLARTEVYEERVIIQRTIAKLIEKCQKLQETVNEQVHYQQEQEQDDQQDEDQGASTMNVIAAEDDQDVVPEAGFFLFGLFGSRRSAPVATPAPLPAPLPTLSTADQIRVMEFNGQLRARDIAGARWPLASPSYWSNVHRLRFDDEVDRNTFFNLWLANYVQLKGANMNPLMEIAKFQEMIAVATAALSNTGDLGTQELLKHKIMQATALKEALEKHPDTAQFSARFGPRGQQAAPVALITPQQKQDFYSQWKSAFKLANGGQFNFDSATATINGQLNQVQNQPPTIDPAQMQVRRERINQLMVLLSQMQVDPENTGDAMAMSSLSADELTDSKASTLIPTDPRTNIFGAPVGETPVMGSFGVDPDDDIVNDQDHWDSVMQIPLRNFEEREAFFKQWITNWAVVNKRRPFVARIEYQKVNERAATLRRLIPTIQNVNPQNAIKMSWEADQQEALRQVMISPKYFWRHITDNGKNPPPVAIGAVSSESFIRKTIFQNPFTGQLQNIFGTQTEGQTWSAIEAVDQEPNILAPVQEPNTLASTQEPNTLAETQSIAAPDEGVAAQSWAASFFGGSIPVAQPLPPTGAGSQPAPSALPPTDPRSAFYQYNQVDQQRGAAYKAYVNDWQAKNPGKTFDPLKEYNKVLNEMSSLPADQAAQKRQLRDALALVSAANPITDSGALNVHSNALPLNNRPRNLIEENGGYLTPAVLGPARDPLLQSPFPLMNYADMLAPDTITDTIVPYAQTFSSGDADSLAADEDQDKKQKPKKEKKQKGENFGHTHRRRQRKGKKHQGQGQGQPQSQVPTSN